MTYDELSAENCTRAITLTLLRERARDLATVCGRMERVVEAKPVEDFVFDNTEGTGDVVSRVRNLNGFIAHHVRKVECLRAVINRKRELKKAWNRTNRGAGNVIREMHASSRAVVDELFRREKSGTLKD